MDRRLFLASTAVAASVTKSGAQQASVQSQLVGVWTLAEASTVSGADILPWFGRTNPVSGLLIAQESGWMSVQISGSRPSKVGRSEYLALSPLEQFAWLKEWYGYYGKFTIDEATGILTYNVADSLLPYERSSSLRRKYELGGDRLTLSTEPRSEDSRTTFNRLVWSKVA